jgi:dethiobiotin synthetase
MLLVCTGTGPGVGTTGVGAAVLRGLRESGISVSARKPVQTLDPTRREPTDREVLAAATGEAADAVCAAHRSYPLPYAPPMAAAALGLPAYELADLVRELAWPEPAPAVRWVESTGGVRSPLADDGDTVSLCARLQPDLVVLVATAGLGAINAVTMSAAALAPHQLVVVLNRYEDDAELHRRNRAWLSQRLRLDVITTPGALVASLIQGVDNLGT